MRRAVTIALATLAVVALALGIRWYFGGHQVPAGQSPRAELTGDGLVSLKAEFNQSADGVRVILLLSPP
jgi:hypothetical protein